jgi:hypothetical protein
MDMAISSHICNCQSWSTRSCIKMYLQATDKHITCQSVLSVLNKEGHDDKYDLIIMRFNNNAIHDSYV